MRALGASQPDSGYPPRRAGDVTISFRKHLIKGICLRYSEEYHEIFYYVYVAGTSCTRVYRVPAGSKNYHPMLHFGLVRTVFHFPPPSWSTFWKDDESAQPRRLDTIWRWKSVLRHRNNSPPPPRTIRNQYMELSHRSWCESTAPGTRVSSFNNDNWCIIL